MDNTRSFILHNVIYLLVLDSFTCFKLTVTEVDYLPDQQHSPDRIKLIFYLCLRRTCPL